MASNMLLHRVEFPGMGSARGGNPLGSFMEITRNVHSLSRSGHEIPAAQFAVALLEGSKYLHGATYLGPNGLLNRHFQA